MNSAIHDAVETLGGSHHRSSAIMKEQARSSGRKGKKRYTQPTSYSSPPEENARSPSTVKRCFCTFFCGRDFHDAWDWKKHEATHLPEMWHCMPDGIPYIGDSCAFCGEHDPQVSHFRTHLNIDECKQAVCVRRQFARKEQLWNHILRVHIDNTQSKDKRPRAYALPNRLNSWFREPQLADSFPQALWCGFCQLTFPKWNERQEHVRRHFLSGDKRKGWVAWRT